MRMLLHQQKYWMHIKISISKKNCLVSLVSLIKFNEKRIEPTTSGKKLPSWNGTGLDTTVASTHIGGLTKPISEYQRTASDEADKEKDGVLT